MQTILTVVCAIFSLLFPLYFWAYMLNLISEDIRSVRFKFWAGVFSGFVSVGSVFVFSTFFSHVHTLSLLIFFVIFLLFFGIFVYFLSQKWSKFSKKFLQLTTRIHGIAIIIIFSGIFLFEKLLTGNFFLAGILATIFIPAFLEEISKHFSVLGVLSQRFAFSLREIAMFSFCVVLGFVFVENILYLFSYGTSISLAVSRSIFSFSAHLLASLLCALAWWKSLSYRFGSWQYFFWFTSGFFAATFSHFFYNWAISSGNHFIFLPYVLASYGLFVYLIKS